MRKRLLSFMAVATMTITAMAQTWTAPVAPQLAGSDPEEGASYYLLNVGTGQFVTGANVWATQISLSANATPYVELITETITQDATVTGTKGSTLTAPGDGWTLRLKERYKFTGDHNRTQGEEWLKGLTTDFFYLFRNDEVSGYVDMNNQGQFVWKLTKAESGDYYWQSIEEETAFPNAADQYAAGKKAGAAVEFNATAESENIEWRFVKPSDFSDSYTAQVALYTARKALYDEYLKAVENNVDPSAYASVYNNTSASVEELNAAASNLKADITRAVVLAKIAESSESNPIDITSVTIENPDFEEGMSPWTITEGMGQNLQVQSQGYPNDPNDKTQPAPGYDEFMLKNFIEAWRSGAALSDGVICQSVSGLPKGRYRIEADVMAVRQYAGEEDQKGIYLFYNNGSYTIHSESLSTENGFPEHFTFDFDYAGDATMTIGLMAESTNCNWMGMDNFRLYAIGQCKDAPSWTALVVAYNTYANYADEIKAEYAKIEAMQNAISDAAPLVNSASDESKEAEYIAAIDKIDEARKALDESAAAYTKLKAFVDQLYADQDKYTGALLDLVEDLYGEWSMAYESGTATPTEIDNAIANYATQIKQKTQEIFEAAVAAGGTLDTPINISALYDYMDFPDTNGSGQEAFAGGFPAANEETGATPLWMNETGTGNFKTNYGTAEVWDARPFNIYRNFTNLPKGSYTIKTHAFYRVETNDSNYPNYTGGSYDSETEYAYLYAGANHTPLTNVAAIANSSFENLDSPYDCGDGNFLPNNQHSASMIFTESRFAEYAKKCYIAATGNVLEDGGTLRVGVAGTDNLMSDHWTIWYTFELYYNGIASLNEEIQALIDQLNNIEAPEVQANITLKNEAIQTGKNAMDQDFDTQKAAINVLQDAINEISQTQELYDQMIAVRNAIDEVAYSTDLTYGQDYETLTAEIDNAGESFQSNDQLRGWIAALPKAWAASVLKADELALASEEDPVDISVVFVNFNFDKNNKDFWTVEQQGNAGGDGNGAAEFWGANNFDMYQVLPSLPAGYYRLSVDALYRFGGTKADLNALEDGTFVNPEFLYANTAAVNIMPWHDTENGAFTDEGYEGTSAYTSDSGSTTVYSCNTKAEFETMIGLERYHNELLFGYGVEQGLSGQVRIGLKKATKPSPDNDWCPFDNFKLEYLGTTTPDAVESIDAQTAGITAIYGIDGRQQSQLRRGVNIVRKSGKVSKVLVK